MLMAAYLLADLSVGVAVVMCYIIAEVHLLLSKLSPNFQKYLIYKFGLRKAGNYFLYCQPGQRRNRSTDKIFSCPDYSVNEAFFYFASAVRIRTTQSGLTAWRNIFIP